MASVERGTIDFDKDAVAAAAQLMGQPRDQFLAAASFAGNEHRLICGRGGFHLVQRASEAFAPANYLFKPFLVP